MWWSLNRARISLVAGSLGLFCILMGNALPGYAASAVEPKAAAMVDGKRFATVWRIRGEVTASGASAGTARKLREGDAVYVGERVRTAALAEAVLKTEDAGIVAIRPSTEFIAERFSAEGKPTDNFALRLATGSLRVISGWIARTNPSDHSIVTRNATIGIRGTDHEPYVLSPELAKSTSNPEGTYDKVNRGGTTLQIGENKLDIDAGRVGFARARKTVKERALMTILLPVLLDKVPDFYVPGQFDAELDRYSQTSDENNLRQLEQKRKTPGATPVAECAPNSIAKTWLEQLDTAIAKHDAPTIIAMFAPDATVRATVRSKKGEMTSVDIEREELAQSTVAAIKGLKNYKQRRVWTEAKLENAAAETTCDRISLKSVVIEQGRQSGKPYRFESLEEYTLELREGKWLSIKAETTQQ
jgi:hypothetical protein